MKFIRFGLFLLFAGSVFAFGAVEVWSQSLLEMGAALLFLCWAVLALANSESKVEWSPLNLPFLAWIAIGCLQLCFHATAYPFLTRSQLLKLGAYFLIFFLLAQVFKTRSELSKLVWFVILLCFVVSVFAIVQHFTSGNQMYWMSRYKTEGAPFGPYVNRNHFAGFLELTLPMSLAMMAFRGVHRELFPLTGLLAIVPVSALVLSGSRGGIVGFALGLAVLALLVGSRRKMELKSARMMALGVVALLALVLVSWIGAGRTIERFSNLNAHDVSLARRASMSLGAVHIFLDHPIRGCGLGTLVSVYPRYETAYDGRVVDHVHNDYAEALAETGSLGGLCGLAFLWLLFREGKRNFMAEQGPLSRAFHAGAIAAVSGLLLHSFVDFNLQIPANALLFLLMTYLATSRPLPPRSTGPRRASESDGSVGVRRRRAPIG
jgi:O-antigen ligase